MGNKPGILLALLLAIILLSYAPILLSPLVADDYYFYSPTVTEQPFRFFSHNLFPEGLDAAFLRPVPILLFTLESFQETWFPILPHLTNILLHLLTVFLVALLITYPSANSSQPNWSAVIVGMLYFGLHPQNTGTVCWVSARFDIIACLAGAGALYAWLRHLDKPNERRWFMAAVAGFCLALFSKETAVVFPCAVLTWEFVKRIYNPHKSHSASILQLSVLITVLGSYLAYRYAVLDGLGGYTNLSLLAPHLSMPLGLGLVILWPLTDRIPLPFYLVLPLILGIFTATFYRARKNKEETLHLPWLLPGTLCILSLACSIVFPLSLSQIWHGDGALGRFTYTSIFACSILIGWVLRKYPPPSRQITVISFLGVFTIFLWAQQVGIHRWRQAGDRAQSIINQTVTFLPSLRPNTTLIFRRIPIQSEHGCAVLGMGLFEALQKRYGQRDFKVVQWPTKDMLNHPPEDSHIFFYRYAEDQLLLER
jgi:hypothetical protein